MHGGILMKYLLIAFAILTFSTVTFADHLPFGSYIRSCSDCSYNKKTDTLRCAGCPRRDGYMIHDVTLTGIQTNPLCNKDIANVDGHLVCQAKATTKSIISK